MSKGFLIALVVVIVILLAATPLIPRYATTSWADSCSTTDPNFACRNIKNNDRPALLLGIIAISAITSGIIGGIVLSEVHAKKQASV